jgi:hypothetical protein
MKGLHFDLNNAKNCSLDIISFNRFVEGNKADFLIKILLSKSDVEDLSKFIWKKYVQILVENLDDDYDYDFEEYEEPFPKSRKTISDNPILIDSYIKHSSLWRECILEEFLFPHEKGKDFYYFVIGYRGIELKDSSIELSFYAYKELKTLK